MFTYRLHLAQLLLVFDGHVVKLFLLLIKLQLKLAVFLLLFPQISCATLLLLVQLHVFTIHDLCQFVHRLTDGKDRTVEHIGRISPLVYRNSME